MEKQKHVHRLKKLRYKSGNEIFFCALPDCNFKTNIALALGKRSICWRCGDEFIMTEYSLRLAKPHCESCHKPKNVVYQIPTHDIEATTELWEPKKEDQELSLAERLDQIINRAKESSDKTEKIEEVEEEI